MQMKILQSVNLQQVSWEGMTDLHVFKFFFFFFSFQFYTCRFSNPIVALYKCGNLSFPLDL